MARIATDPNYSSPTFPRATAGTDLFLKEDVQALAAAVSTHDHSTGKGVALTAGAIPNGTITSAMIADGTIQTADLVLGAVSGIATGGGFLGGSTTSTSPVSVAGLTTSALTCVGGGRPVLVFGTLTVQCSGSAQNANIFLMRDASSIGCLAIGSSAAASQIFVMHFMYLDTGAAAGSHTWTVQWSTNTGTLSLISSAFSSVTAMEMRA